MSMNDTGITLVLSLIFPDKALESLNRDFKKCIPGFVVVYDQGTGKCTVG